MTGEQHHARRIDVLPKEVEAAWRFVSGKRIKYGNDHDGMFSNRQHQAIRLGTVPALGFVVWLRFTHPFLYDTLKWFVILGVPVAAITWVVWRVRNIFLFRNDLYPLHRGLRVLAGWDGDPVKPWHWLHFPLRWRDDKGAEFRVDLKHDVAQTDKDKELFVSVMGQKLGTHIDPSDVKWKMDDRKPHAVVKLARPPTAEALWADWATAVSEYTSGSVWLAGVGKHNKKLTVDMDTEFPHVLICSDPGGGKSYLLGSAGCQLAHKGAFLVILDPKQTSLRAFKGLPNVLYCGTAAECHCALLAARAEMDHRSGLMAGTAWDEKFPNPGARVVFLIEETDSLIRDLRALWERWHRTRSNVPSILELVSLRAMGRELRMHQIAVSQSGSAASQGGGDARSLYGGRIIRGDKSVWDKAAPNIKPPPDESDITGRFHLLKHGKPSEMQALKFADPPKDHKELKMAEAREHATSGDVADIPEVLKRVYDSELARASKLTVPTFDAELIATADPIVTQSMTHSPHLRLVDPDDAPVSLATVVGHVNDRLISLAEFEEKTTLSLSGLRSASNRQGFPQEQPTRRAREVGAPEKVYRETDLVEWESRRVARLGVNA